MKLKVYLSVLVILFCLPVSAAEHQAAVAMPDSFSADAAALVLKQGGNAVDAAITAQFVLAVTLPEAGNLGGGGFMLVRKDGYNDFIDYREKAPLTADRDMYLDSRGKVIHDKSLYSIFASGVPGTVAGMWLAHKKYGSLPWQTLVQPAVDLAEHGFIVPAKLKAHIDYYLNKMARKGIKVNFADYFAKAETGQLFKQPELAQSLTRIRDDGPNGFYQGKTADLIVDFMQQQGGLISHKDLKSYQAKSRAPIVANWHGYQVVTAPPPSSGGIAILQSLKMYQLKAADLQLKHNSTTYIHLLAEIGKRVFADRADYLGDPDFAREIELIFIPISLSIFIAFSKASFSDLFE